ncbi:MAG TPA: CvpA family protein [Tepidisphaeraceae bacterium]|jgi:hypothetical protein
MIFNIFILIALLGVAYFHYVQGAFTSLISVFCALLATLIAFGYYEQVFGFVPAGGKVINHAPGMIFIALFAVSYLVLRILFDSVAPGNLRLPAVGDKAGAAVLGLVAGLFGSGVLATGAQMLPFGPTIGGFGRHVIDERPVILPGAATGGRSDVDTKISNELKENTLSGDKAGALLVPSDGFVTAVARMASDGAFPGALSLSAVHPDLLTELFANRLGAETGSTRIATGAGTPPATLQGVFIVPTMKMADTEITRIRQGEKAVTYQPKADEILIALRLKFDSTATDPDGYVRLTPGSSRLMLGNRTYYPIGSLAADSQIGLARLDDLITIPLKGDNNSADLVYAIDKTTLDRVAPNGTFKSDAGFLQIKLLARLPITGKAAPWTPGKGSAVMRKAGSPFEGPAAKPAGAAATPPVTPPAAP